MSKISKRRKEIKTKIESGKIYSPEEAIQILKECSTVKFNETVEASINLGLDTRKSDQNVRSSTVLPHGTGKTVRIAVFAQGDQAEAAKKAGADIVGYEDLAAGIKEGNIDFDVVIATPDSMRIVGALGQILGPKGLMPNPKVGTVTADIETAVKNAKGGQVRYRTEKAGIIHCPIGKINFTIEQLKENLAVLIADIKKAKPSTAKGTYIKKITLSSTMGPGLVIDLTALT